MSVYYSRERDELMIIKWFKAKGGYKMRFKVIGGSMHGYTWQFGGVARDYLKTILKVEYIGEL